MSRAWKSTGRLLLLASVSILTNACLVIPLPPHDPSRAAAGWLADNGSNASREDVLLQIGAPDLVREKDSLLVYIWHDPRAFWILAAGAPGGGAGVAGGAVGGIIEKEFAVVVEFDPRGVLTRYAVASHLLTRKGCTPSNICVEDSPGESFSLLMDTEHLERSDHLVYELVSRVRDPNWLETQTALCTLYVFPRGLSIGAVHLDGRFAGYASQDGFLRLPASPGMHDVSVAHASGSPPSVSTQTLRLECPEASERFVVQQSAGVLGLGPGKLEILPSGQAPDRTRRFLHAMRE